MKTFETLAAQGDVLFMKVSFIPSNAVKAALAKDGRVIVAHSETGHHHAFPKDSGITLFTTPDPLTCYLQCVTAEEGGVALLEHHRPFDTHETIGFKAGLYMVRRQREWTPEGWRRVED